MGKTPDATGTWYRLSLTSAAVFQIMREQLPWVSDRELDNRISQAQARVRKMNCVTRVGDFDSVEVNINSSKQLMLVELALSDLEIILRKMPP